MTPRIAEPTPAQVAWHDLELGIFIHWSPGTYENTPGGHDTPKTPSSVINPNLLDTEQWVDVTKAMGAKFIVLVAKHVGGFCIWQTQTTRLRYPQHALARRQGRHRQGLFRFLTTE
ncbi:MAG: alpha-L-fucosidase [Planctomycetota bacterium]|jgi:alpha-L-fucosidase|nr:alpha-L-fucosidase [Planctomycetota bacterium]